MISLKKQHKANRKIGEELKISKESVGYCLKKFMLDYNKYKHPGIALQEINEMIGMEREGKLNREIGQELGRSTNLVGRYLQRFMSDYDKYKYLKISQQEITEMIKLKRRYKRNQDIGEKLETNGRSVGYYLKKFMPDYGRYKSVKVSEKAIKRMIVLKRKGKSNEEIAQELNYTVGSVRLNLVKYMPDYDYYPKVSEEAINRMIVLKRKGKTNKEIAREVGCAKITIQLNLIKYMLDYHYHPIVRVSEEDKEKRLKRRERREKFKLNEYQEQLKNAFKNREVTSQQVYIVSLYKPTVNLLESNLKIKEIEENKERILDMIKKIIRSLFRVSKNRSPGIVFATAIYLSTPLTMKRSSEISNMSIGPICSLLKLIKLKKVISRKKLAN